MSAQRLPIDDGKCFACGPFADHGVGLRFEPDGGDGVKSDIVLHARFQGWAGIAHGGIVMTMLDEGMAHACAAAGERGMTAEAKVRFRHPVPLESPLVVRGRIEEHRGRLLRVASTVELPDGTVLASAEGSFMSAGKLGKPRLGSPDVIPPDAGDAE